LLKHRVAMVVSNEHFPDDVRVFREAVTLSKKFKVLVIVWDRSGKKNEKEIFEQDIEVFRIKLKSSYRNLSDFIHRLPFFWFLSFLLLVRLKVSVIHCHDFDTLPLGILMKILNPRIKVVFDSHEHYPSMVSPEVPKILEKIISILFVSLPSIVDAVIVVNDYLKEFFKKCKRVAVVMNVPPLNEPNRASSEKMNSGGLFNLFYFGGLSADRGIYYLIDVAKMLSNVKLIVAGDGPAKEEVVNYSIEYPNIEYLGWLAYKKILDYIAASDLIPILYSSKILNNKIVTPNKLFLAMGFGKPVIVYSGTLAEQIVKMTKVGFSIHENDLKELIDTITTLINNERLAQAICENGKKAFSTKYNWEIMEDRLTSLYESML
jgi:glycosyltransferase involved in cell wall biosynthesis